MSRRQRGFALIFALFVVGMIGLTLLLLGRHFGDLSQSARATATDVRVAQLLASGQAWAAAHREAVARLAPGESIDLPVADLAPPDAKATLRITRERDEGRVVITATVRQGRTASRSTTPVPPPTTRPSWP